MLRRSLFLGLGAVALSSYSWGLDLSARLFSPASLPAGCQMIAGDFPVGDRTSLVWNYERYAVVMPPYKEKLAQSFQCGSGKGTLYFFDYATEAQKEHALLFAKPVLAKQHGAAHELPIREWTTGFVLVSFPETPAKLLAALDERLTGKIAAPRPPSPERMSTPTPSAPARPVIESAPALPPLKPVKVAEPVHELPSPAAAPPPGTADVSNSVLESYASKMGCESPDQNLQTKMVCGFMQEFAGGLPPELSFKPESIVIGPVYTVDANGRFMDLHYDALVGARDPGVVSFFSLPSTGGKDDFEIKQLVEARKAKTALPENDMAARLPALAAAKRMVLRKTAARSAVIEAAPNRRLYIRRAGDHWIVIGVSGNSTEAQLNTSLAVIVLY
jgi:hypothetical protein